LIRLLYYFKKLLSKDYFLKSQGYVFDLETWDATSEHRLEMFSVLFRVFHKDILGSTQIVHLSSQEIFRLHTSKYLDVLRWNIVVFLSSIVIGLLINYHSPKVLFNCMIMVGSVNGTLNFPFAYVNFMQYGQAKREFLGRRNKIG